MKTLLLLLITLTSAFGAIGQTKTYDGGYGFSFSIPEKSRIEDNSADDWIEVIIDYQIKDTSYSTIICSVKSSSTYTLDMLLKLNTSLFEKEDRVVNMEPRTFNGNSGKFLSCKGLTRYKDVRSTMYEFATQKGDKIYFFWVMSWYEDDTGLKASFEKILNSLEVK